MGSVVQLELQGSGICNGRGVSLVVCLLVCLFLRAPSIFGSIAKASFGRRGVCIGSCDFYLLFLCWRVTSVCQ